MNNNILILDFNKGWNLAVPAHYVEKKQGFSYLSWMYAIQLLNEHFPGIHVDFVPNPATGGPVWYEEGTFLMNYGKNLVEGRTAYLRPFLTNGEASTPPLYFPVMDARKNAALHPCPRVVNDNIQRAISKTISTYTGIGAKLYVGEDLEHLDPQQSTPAPTPAAPVAAEPTLGSDQALQAWFHAKLNELGLNDHGRETLKIVMKIESTNSLTKSKAEAVLTRLNKVVVEAFNEGKHPQSGEVVNALPVPKTRKKKTVKETAEQLADQFDGEVIPEEMPI